ncbi:unnamed protein product, partial [Rotaria socialis]
FLGIAAGVIRRLNLRSCCVACKCELKLSNVSTIIGIGKSIANTPTIVIMAPNIIPGNGFGTISPKTSVLIVLI